MCGIFGYIGNESAYKIIINGLKTLEYRGYDSYGVALKDSSEIFFAKKVGNISKNNLEDNDSLQKFSTGIGHTRWATHGDVNEINSHPHHDKDEIFFVVHNGIIENYEELKNEYNLTDFYSNTDSEIIPKLISHFFKRENMSFLESVTKTSGILKGNFAFVAFSKKDNDVIAVKMGSPLVIGVLEEKYHEKDMSLKSFFMSSDVNSLLKHTRDVYFLDDGDIAIISSNDSSGHTISFFNFIKNSWSKGKIDVIEFENKAIDIRNFEHFMLKEIYEQPEVFSKTVRKCSSDVLKIIPDILGKKKIKRIIITACGTSWHSGIIGSYWFEQISKIPAKIEYASEFRYKDPIIEKDTLVIAISQSGETADTIAAIEEAKSKNATILSICNVKKSTIDRISDFTIITAAGPEIGVASTKAFTTQMATLFMIAYYLKNDNSEQNTVSYHLFEELGTKMQEILTNVDQIKKIAEKYSTKSNALFLGRGVNYPVALEGALKLKEISYIHAEGYPAAEMKHGPIALIDSDMPSIFICVKDKSYKKVISNIREVKARHGKVIAIANNDDDEIIKYTDDIIYIPKVDEILVPFLTVIPLQLLAYYIANKRGCEIDKPRNLAKSVTVE